MSFKNCVKCGKLYESPNPRFCSECVKADEDEYTVVRNFIKDNPKVSLEVVAEATGVPEDKIIEFLRQGRLEAACLSGNVLQCMRCGKPIIEGQYCVLCRTHIAETFKSGKSEKTKDTDEKTRQKSFSRQYRYRK